MADNSNGAVKKKGGPGRPFKPGQTGNPGGYSKARRERAAQLRDGLFAVFVEGEPPNKIIIALERGVDEGCPQCIKLALSYMYGQPDAVIELTGDGGGPVLLNRRLTDAELEAIAAQALPEGKAEPK